MKRNTLSLLLVGFAGLLLLSAASPVSRAQRDSREITVYLSPT
jgi:hypothetical protein